MSERCEGTDEWMSECPSTVRVNPVVNLLIVAPSEKNNNLSCFTTLCLFLHSLHPSNSHGEQSSESKVAEFANLIKLRFLIPLERSARNKVAPCSGCLDTRTEGEEESERVREKALWDKTRSF